MSQQDFLMDWLWGDKLRRKTKPIPIRVTGGIELSFSEKGQTEGGWNLGEGARTEVLFGACTLGRCPRGDVKKSVLCLSLEFSARDLHFEWWIYYARSWKPYWMMLPRNHAWDTEQWGLTSEPRGTPTFRVWKRGADASRGDWERVTGKGDQDGVMSCFTKEGVVMCIKCC